MKRDLELYLAAAWSAVAPLHPIFAMLVVLPTLDLALACIVARMKRGEKVTSYGIGRTIGKVTLYLTSVTLAFATEKWLTGQSLGILTFMTTVIGARELKSCLEHLDTLHGGSLLQSATTLLVPGKRPPPSDGDPK